MSFQYIKRILTPSAFKAGLLTTLLCCVIYFFLVPQKPEILSSFDTQITDFMFHLRHVKLHQDFYEADRKGASSHISVSKPRGTCIPSLSDLSCLCCSLKPRSRHFERSTSLEASSFCRNRQTFIVPPQSRGGAYLREITQRIKKSTTPVQK